MVAAVDQGSRSRGGVDEEEGDLVVDLVEEEEEEGNLVVDLVEE